MILMNLFAELQFTQKLNVLLRKIKSKISAGFAEITPEEWRTRKFIRFCND